jgi:hypothetical protein
MSNVMKDFKESHEQLSDVAKVQNCTESCLVRAVSRHVLPETASFANLEAISGHTEAPCFVGTSAKQLALSAHLEAPQGPGGDDHRPAKKRRRNSNAEDEADRVAGARARLAKDVPDLPAEELHIAEAVLVRLVNLLRGTEGEVCVQSYALLAKKLSDTDPRARVVIAARLNAGIAMPVGLLKACLGECWEDGLLTTLPTLHGISEVDLPYSPEAEAALAYGNAPLLLVTSVATR